MSTDGGGGKRKTDGGESGAKRQKRKTKVALSALPRHHQSPAYEAHSRPSAGGACSTAILGPNSLIEMGSDADSNKPPAIASARETYPECSFKAGHLLNADFGGDGKMSKNLTILSAKGNSNHKNFDNNVKQALYHLKKLYELLSNAFVDISDIDYGVEVKIQTSFETWGENPPDCYICDHLKCSAKEWGAFSAASLMDVDGDDVSDAVKSEADQLKQRVKKCLKRAAKKIRNPSS